MEVKKGVPFGESSPMLNDISGVPSWDKVAQGMFKMYNVEVLGKVPVIQHLKFGLTIAIHVFVQRPRRHCRDWFLGGIMGHSLLLAKAYHMQMLRSAGPP